MAAVPLEANVKKTKQASEAVLPYQADIAEVKQAERPGGDGFGLDEVLQDVRGSRLDVTVVLTDRRRGRCLHEQRFIKQKCD